MNQNGMKWRERVRRASTLGMQVVAGGMLWGFLTLACAGQHLAASAEAPLLPDAPSARMNEAKTEEAAEQISGMPEPVAKKYKKFIPAGWQAQTLSAGDKIVLTLRDTYTPESFIGFTLAAGYSQVVNGQPNYGTDRGAFGERLGAAAVRDTSQNIFTGAVFAPILHEDPRYYVEGDRYNVFHRTFYAATRPLITRGDNGRNHINSSLLLGYAAAAALTNEYYPRDQRTATTTARTYGASIGGAAFGCFAQEFLDDALQVVHLRRKQDP